MVFSSHGDMAISIHAPAKGATQVLRGASGVCAISIHAPAKGATIDFSFSGLSIPLFQSTLPRRERLRSCYRRHSNLNFNPRSREGSDPAGVYELGGCVISIRAPAKGATRSTTTGTSWTTFQSALPRRERHLNRYQAEKANHFNPRSREGSDVTARAFLPAQLAISIRAPAKGATQSRHCRPTRPRDFNPRSREGSDRI